MCEPGNDLLISESGSAFQGGGVSLTCAGYMGRKSENATPLLLLALMFWGRPAVFDLAGD